LEQQILREESNHFPGQIFSSRTFLASSPEPHATGGSTSKLCKGGRNVSTAFRRTPLCALWKQLREIAPRAREAATVMAGDGRGQIYFSRLGWRCLTFFLGGVGGTREAWKRKALVLGGMVVAALSFSA